MTIVEVRDPPAAPELEAAEAPEPYVLTRPDYDAVRPDDEVEETEEIFEAEAQMSAIDFDNPNRWRVRTADDARLATVEDQVFLGRVAGGLAILASDIFRLRLREDAVYKNGTTRRTGTVLQVISHRRAANGDDA